ncbi:GNAT family protein [Streptomyces sp. CB01881]|uniref:GNAT family N-acetyltransferase n=1 Tax=Streptomyces sp. CB01881 TaxID=2078691 RepID=UPI000CDCAA75|nr:GNAT family protein [Streptomyces sp. CB01881]AUY52239.1 N-acetyltransferase [Streptomyces sp. CB01881]TYC71663.1 N-acetyltransferase [Streptomyces sp. CB01881]
MSDDRVILRPMSEADLPVLERLLSDPEAVGALQWYGWSDPGRLRRKWAEDGLLGADQSQLAVVSGGEFCGFVAWRRAAVVPSAPYWNVGIQLIPQARGRGIGTQAQRLLVDYLFAHSPVVRLEADTETVNLAEQRALEKCGFTREGVQRSLVFRDGAWRDIVRYSLLRGDARP